jgi:uncharacterized membrane protein YkoI
VRIVPALLLAASVLAASHALPARERSEQDRARAAVAAGDRLPLSRILALVEAQVGGRVLEIELDDDDGREVYEIDILGGDGRVRELKVDPATGAILGQELDD